MRQATEGAHKHGMRRHAWIVCWRVDQYADKALVERERAAGRLQVDMDGKPKDWYCPSFEENRRRTADIACEIASRGVDGVHLDFIRFDGQSCCYCPRCRSLFEEHISRKVENWPTDTRWSGPCYEEWFSFRADLISKTVEETSRRVREANPAIVISAAVLRHSLFRHKHAKRLKLKYRPWAITGQDAALWLEKGWVDYVCPMNYRCNSWDDTRELAALQESVAPGRVYPGIGLSGWEYPGGAAARLAEQQDAIRAAGCAGSTVYVLDDDRMEYLEKWW